MNKTTRTSTVNLRSMLKSGQPVVGSWINTASPIVAELMAAAGFDFLTIDAEHSAVDLPQVQQLCQAVTSGSADCKALVRVPGCSYREIKRYMDAGAAGIICPLVNTAEQAREVVEAVRYPPEGRRGVGFCRDNIYGARLGERLRDANDESVVCVQIEHIDGVANIQSILKVKGIDAAFIGPYDLSASLGVPGNFTDSRYLKALGQIRKACTSRKTAVGIHIIQPDAGAILKAYDEGYRLLAFSLDITMLTSASRDGLKAIREGLARRI